MQSLPHVYHAEAMATPSSKVIVEAAYLPTLATDAPPEFGGPEGLWSPETLFMAAIADCFVLSFRAIARASKFEWSGLRCTAHGYLDKDAEGVLRFTRIELRPVLSLTPGSDEARAQKLLEKAERSCLVSNSLRCDIASSAELVYTN